MNKKQFIAEGALFSNTLIWGGTFVMIKSALAFISPMMFVSIRFSIATLLLLPFVYPLFKTISKKQLSEGFILGVFLYIGFAVQTIGLQYTTATKSAFITGTFVLFTPILQTIIEKRIPTLGNIFGVLLVTVGIIFLSSKENSLFSIFSELSEGFNFGDFLTLICAIFYAVYIVYLDKISANHNHRFLTFAQISVTGMLSILSVMVFSFLQIEPIKIVLNSEVVIAILYTTLFATILTTSMQTKFQQAVTPTRASIIFSMEPLFAAVTAYFFINEKLSNFGIAGAAFIFLGILISELWPKK
ncbi:MAG: DMT family transporter [Ignavibacteriaceae bacterium]|jgi:drug/metabolite transporter (DMT)-like permease|nr:DMT family transporter [Ignavibacteriaceae bacterium]